MTLPMPPIVLATLPMALFSGAILMLALVGVGALKRYRARRAQQRDARVEVTYLLPSGSNLPAFRQRANVRLRRRKYGLATTR
jgi:hypothetical protein